MTETETFEATRLAKGLEHLSRAALQASQAVIGLAIVLYEADDEGRTPRTLEEIEKEIVAARHAKGEMRLYYFLKLRHRILHPNSKRYDKK